VSAASVPGPELSSEDKQTLLALARQAISEHLRTGQLPPFRTRSPALREQRATFVTLRRRGSGELRGCRGECYARQRLYASVINSAINAATDDTRFPPVTLDEIGDLHIEISVLTPMKPIRPEEVEVGRHGLMILKAPFTGLLLPEVAVRYGWGREEFLEWVCKKAELPLDTWQAEDAELYGFETEEWGEDD
jgi:AmmeMemoRadiSam system protein A